METYHLECGRAGRDDLPANCVMYYRPADVPKLSSKVYYEPMGLQNLYDMVRYCESTRECRRCAFSRHFSEALQECNGMCDNCAFPTEYEKIDATFFAIEIISLLQDADKRCENMTMSHLVEEMKYKHNILGLCLRKDEIERLIVQLILDDILKEDFWRTDYKAISYVILGPNSKQVLDGKKMIELIRDPKL